MAGIKSFDQTLQVPVYADFPSLSVVSMIF